MHHLAEQVSPEPAHSRREQVSSGHAEPAPGEHAEPSQPGHAQPERAQAERAQAERPHDWREQAVRERAEALREQGAALRESREHSAIPLPQRQPGIPDRNRQPTPNGARRD